MSSEGGSRGPAALPHEGEEDRYLLAFEEARHALTTQQEDLNSLQSRALGLLSAATLATSFLGGLGGLGLLRRAASAGGAVPSRFTLWEILLVVILFGGTVVCCLVVLWPAGEWVFQLDPGGTVEVLDLPQTKEVPLAVIYRDFALRLHSHAAKNEARLRMRVWGLRGAIIVLALNVGYLLLIVGRK